MKKIIALIAGIALIMSSVVVAHSLIINSNSKSIANDPNLYLSLGNFLLRNGYKEAALSVYQKALELEPENSAVLNNLGYYYREINPLLAEDYFLKALQSNADYETARNNLAVLYNSIGDYGKAAEQLVVLHTMHPENVNYAYDLAVNLAQKFYYQTRSYNDLVSSIYYFRFAYNLEPGFGHAIENIKTLNEIKREIER